MDQGSCRATLEEPQSHCDFPDLPSSGDSRIRLWGWVERTGGGNQSCHGWHRGAGWPARLAARAAQLG